MRAFTFDATRAVRFGSGISSELSDDVAALLGRRVLVVVDAGISRLGLAEPCMASLRRAGAAVSVFGGVLPEPPDKNVEAAATERARDGERGDPGQDDRY